MLRHSSINRQNRAVQFCIVRRRIVTYLTWGYWVFIYCRTADFADIIIGTHAFNFAGQRPEKKSGIFFYFVNHHFVLLVGFPGIHAIYYGLIM